MLYHAILVHDGCTGRVEQVRNFMLFLMPIANFTCKVYLNEPTTMLHIL